MVPRWIIRLLERVVASDEHDDVIGDLEEMHRRRSARLGRIPATIATVVEGLVLCAIHGLRRVPGFGLSWTEVRLALRLMLRQPVMTVTSIVALGIGIGIAAGGFSVFRQALYSDLPFENGDRWVVIETWDADAGRRSRLDLERLRTFRESASAFDYIAGAESVEFNVVHDDGRIERVPGARVTPGTFAHLPWPPVAGRLLGRGDGAAGGEPVVVIRESLWERSFGRDPDVIGLSIDIAGEDHRIVGVLPDEAGYPSEGELWLPFDEETMGAETDRDPLPGTRQPAILAEGVSTDEAEQQLARLSAAVSAPGRGAAAQRHVVTPITQTIAGGQSRMLLGLVMSVLLTVLAVIAANVANLVVARTSRRAPELAVRTALGASRTRIVGQLFVEVLAMGVPAAALGLALAGGMLSVYDRLLDELPFWVQLRLDPWTAVVVVALSLFASAVMGLIPALRATRSDPARSLREAGGRTTGGIGRFGGAMIAAEVALSVALLGAGVVFAQGFRAYVDPSVHLPDDRVLTARIALDIDESDLREGGAPSVEDSMAVVLERLADAVAQLPGVRASGVTTHLPRAAPGAEPMVVEGRSDLVRAAVARQGPGLFDVLDTELILGRDLQATDRLPGARRVVVVNQAFAGEAFGTDQVLGRRIRVAPEGEGGPEEPWLTIVGVAPNVMEVTASSGAAVYVPLTSARFVSAALRVDRDPVAMSGVLRRAIFDLDPGLDVSGIVRLDDVGAENRTALVAMSSAMTAIGLVTLLLALAGVYSIVSLTVTRRTKEIGVRVALGADATSILRSVLGRSGLLVLSGAVVGALAGIRFSRLDLFVFALPEPGTWLFPALVGSMTLAGLLACWVPARRALAIQPTEAITNG